MSDGNTASTLRRMVRLAPVGRGRFAASVALGALAIAFGVALMTTAGYLISRAAEMPDILSLTVVIVAVRFFGIGRPLIRYFDRLVSHDMALRALGTLRSTFYARIEPLAPAQLEGFRHGELLSRMVGDVDALQGLYLRGLAPPVVALVVAAGAVGFAAFFLPSAALILLAGLALSGVAVPWLAARLQSASGLRQRGARADLTAEVVEFLRGAPELLVNGAAEAALERAEARDRELARLARRDAFVAGLADALSVLITGTTTVAVLTAAVAAHHDGSLDRLMIATLALLTLSSFEATAPLPETARELGATVESGRRVLELTDTAPEITDPDDPTPPPADPTVRLDGVTAVYPAADTPTLTGLDLTIAPGRAGRAARPERDRQEHDRRAPAPLPRPRRREGPRRRRRRPRPAPARPAGTVRTGGPGRPPVQLDDRGQPADRTARRRRGRPLGGARRGAPRRLGPLAPSRARARSSASRERSSPAGSSSA